MMAERKRFHHLTNRIAVTAVSLFALVAADTALAAKGKHGVRSKLGAVTVSNSQMEPAFWEKMEGWAEDDHMAGFNTFMQSCKAILKSSETTRAQRPLLGGLYNVCVRAADENPKDAKEARAFFEKNFRPVNIAPIGEKDGFLTGYYEPVVDGTREPKDAFTHPLYRRPGGLLTGGKMLRAAAFGSRKAKKGQRSARRVGSFYDRAAIEDGALNGRKLEICYLKDPVDAFFIHIQGSVRVRLDDGKMMRLNYDSQNGHAYTAVGKFLIDRKIYTREEMSMEKIREWMNANPEEGKELRRLNKSYVFFRETGLADNEEAIGAQGVSLTPGRSIAVDRKLHVYGTPMFISALLPIQSEASTTPFRRLMVAQDTGGAIIGPARADIYLGAGAEAGVISGRFKNPGRFTMLFPNEVDPFKKARDIPLPRPRPKLPGDDKPAELVAEKPAAPVVAPVAQPEKKAEPAKVAVAKPEPVKPEKKPEAKKVEAAKPEARKADAKKPEPKKPDAKAEAKKPEAKPETKKTAALTKPDVKKKEAEAKKPEVKKTEKKTEAAKPDAKKPAPKTKAAAETASKPSGPAIRNE
jgi:membrane-bound lytic murein transglycosylase A